MAERLIGGPDTWSKKWLLEADKLMRTGPREYPFWRRSGDRYAAYVYADRAIAINKSTLAKRRAIRFLRAMAPPITPARNLDYNPVMFVKFVRTSGHP